MTISAEQTIVVVGMFASVTTSIFWSAFLLGRLHQRMESVESGVAHLDARMDRAGQKMSDLADEVQKMPEKFLTRQEALIWRGSRVDDRA